MSENLAKEIKALCEKHGVILSGDVRVYDAKEADAIPDSFTAESKMKLLNCGGLPYHSGPYLVFDFKQKKAEKHATANYGSAPYIQRDYEAYECPVTGKMVEGRAAHRENLKRTGCRVLEKGEKEHNEKRREEDFNQRVERSVDNWVNTTASELAI